MDKSASYFPCNNHKKIIIKTISYIFNSKKSCETSNAKGLFKRQFLSIGMQFAYV